MMLSLNGLYCCITIVTKINLNRGGLNVDSPGWIKNQKATTNPINDDDKCFQYVATLTLNHEEMGKKFAKNLNN